MIKLVIFDAYGVVLTGGYSATCRYLAEKFDRDWEKLYEVIYKRYLNMAAERKITQEEAWEKSVEELKLPMTWQELRDLHYSLMGLNQEMINFLKNLKIKTTLLTKNTRDQLADVNAIFHLERFLDYIINTWEINLPKASKETIQYVLNKFKVKPEEVIYIDDQEENLAAAKAIGVHTILYKKDFEEFKKESLVLL